MLLLRSAGTLHQIHTHRSPPLIPELQRLLYVMAACTSRTFSKESQFQAFLCLFLFGLRYVRLAGCLGELPSQTQTLRDESKRSDMLGRGARTQGAIVEFRRGGGFRGGGAGMSGCVRKLPAHVQVSCVCNAGQQQ